MEPVVIILIVLALIGLIICVVQYNSIKSLKNKVSQSRSGIDVALTKRFDLIPNLVECVKGYCSHEEKVLTDVVKSRTEYLNTKKLSDGESLNNKTNAVLMLAEKYPNLKSNAQFIELQAALERTENSLAAARRLYNSDVTVYNTKIQTFPGNIFAIFMGAKQANFFEIEKNVKDNIKINI